MSRNIMWSLGSPTNSYSLFTPGCPQLLANLKRMETLFPACKVPKLPCTPPSVDDLPSLFSRRDASLSLVH